MREAVFFCVALAAIGLFAMIGLPDFEFCLLERLGIPCLGRGLARSMIAFLHLDFSGSFELHPLGPIVLVMLSFRAVRGVFPRKLRAH